ncbi:MAG TPA: antitoxin family protein [Chloroflexia bacterium]|jgi:predicted DNA-binding antitoxin AbrB/MazE fold protein
MEQTTEVENIVEAVYEAGVFRPLSPVVDSVSEGQHVRLTILPVLEAADSDDPLELLRNVYAGLSEEEIDEIEKIMLDRSNWRSKPEA